MCPLWGPGRGNTLAGCFRALLCYHPGLRGPEARLTRTERATERGAIFTAVLQEQVTFPSTSQAAPRLSLAHPCQLPSTMTMDCKGPSNAGCPRGQRLRLSRCSLCSCCTDLLADPLTLQLWSCPGAFAQAVPSAWTIRDFHPA